MPGEQLKKRGHRPRCQTALRSGMIAAAAFSSVFVIRSVLSFPFEPKLSLIQVASAIVAVLLFFGGVLALLLAPRLGRRFMAIHAMAAAAAILFIAVAGDGGAWLAGMLGWGAAACMSAWGAFLARGITGRGRGEELRS